MGKVVPFSFHKSAAIALRYMAKKDKDNHLLLSIANSLWHYPSEGHWEVASERATKFVLANAAAREDYERFIILRDARKEVELA